MSRLIKLFFLIVLAAVVWEVTLFLAWTDKSAHLNFCDIGQGDAIHIRLSYNQDIIVDTGADQSIAKCLSQTMPTWDRTIEHLAVTHFDQDHSGGVATILERYTVENFYVAQEIPEKYKRLLTPDINVVRWHAGKKLTINDLDLIALWPPSDYQVDSPNAASLVLRGSYLQHSFLLTGDLEIEQEEILIKQGSLWPTEILKVGHHGSKSSTSADLLSALKPDIAVISVGAKNRYGHPTEEVLERLAGVRVLRTDLDGTIQCDLNKPELHCYSLAN